MRILSLVTDAFGSSGGIAQYNRDLMIALAESEYVESVDILPRHGQASCILPQRLRQRDPVTGKLTYAAHAIRLVQQTTYDLIFCGHINLLPLANRLAQKRESPVWLQLHGIDAWRRPARIRRAHLERVRLTTAVSRYTRQRFQEWANLAPHYVKVLPNTIGVPRGNILADDMKLPLAVQHKTILLTVGRLAANEAYKGHDRVIRCLSALREKVDLAYLIAGDGDDRPRLQELAREQGVADDVIFFGRVSDDELDALYRQADLFVMPSTGEGFGIVFLEAMARGTTSLGLNTDGSVDPLQDGKLGVTVDPHDLCGGIEKALAKPPQPMLEEQVQQAFGTQSFVQHVQSLIEPFRSMAAAGDQ